MSKPAAVLEPLDTAGWVTEKRSSPDDDATPNGQPATGAARSCILCGASEGSIWAKPWCVFDQHPAVA